MNITWMAVAGALLTACTPTAHERFGDVARYAPEYGGYIVGSAEAPVILRDPVTSEKIRCEDDLARAAPALAAILEDEARDRHAKEVAVRALLPFYVAGTGAELLGIGLFSPVIALHQGVAPPQPRSVYEQARHAFDAGRFAEAREKFGIVVLVRGQGSGESLPTIFVEHALYYLALSDEAIHRDVEAKAALRRFLGASSGKNEIRYRDAEARLARLEAGHTCASRADFTFAARSR